MSGEGERDWVGVAYVGKPVLVMEMKRPRACMRVGSDQAGLSEHREETASSRQVLSLDLSGQ